MHACASGKPCIIIRVAPHTTSKPRPRIKRVRLWKHGLHDLCVRRVAVCWGSRPAPWCTCSVPSNLATSAYDSKIVLLLAQAQTSTLTHASFYTKQCPRGRCMPARPASLAQSYGSLRIRHRNHLRGSRESVSGNTDCTISASGVSQCAGEVAPRRGARVPSRPTPQRRRMTPRSSSCSHRRRPVR